MAGSCGSQNAHTWVPGCGATEALSLEAAAREDQLSFREALGRDVGEAGPQGKGSTCRAASPRAAPRAKPQLL